MEKVKEQHTKESVVGRLQGKELKEFRIEASNKIRFIVEAFDEEDAEKRFEAILEEDYDYPYNNAEDYDGWQIELVEEA